MAGLTRAVIAKPRGIAEGDHPGVVHQQEIKNRCEDFRFARAAPQFVRPQPGGAQEDRQQFVVRRDLAKGLQRQGFGVFLLTLQFGQIRPGFEIIC